MPPALRTASRAVDSEDVLGGVALRDSEFIKTAGHIDYGIRPSARRPSARDVGSTGAAQNVRLLGIEHVLLVCAADNEASARMIERTGGVLESIQPTSTAQHAPNPKMQSSPSSPMTSTAPMTKPKGSATRSFTQSRQSHGVTVDSSSGHPTAT